MTGVVAEQLYVRRGRRETRGEGRLIVRELRRLIAESVERTAVRQQDLHDARVRPLGDLLYLFERGHAERVKRERADGITHVDAIEKQRVRMDVEA